MTPEQFLTFADPLPEPMLLLASSGLVLAGNRAVEKRLGIALPAIRGSNLTDAVTDTPDDVAHYLRSCSRSRSLVLGSLVMLSKAGECVPCRAEGTLLRPRSEASEALLLLRLIPKDSAVGKFLALNQRIESLDREFRLRRHAEGAVRQQAERLRVTLHSIGDGVISTDAQGRVDFLNPVAEELVGWEMGEAVGQRLEDVFHIVNETTRQPVENPALRALRDGKIVGLANHTVLISKDGTECPIDDSAAPIRDQQGAIFGSVLVFRDITKRKQVEEDLRLRDRAIRAVSEGILITDAGQRDNPIIFATPGFERITGYSAAEAVGRNCRFLQGPETDKKSVAQLREAIQGGCPCTVELLNYRKDGSPFWNSLSISPVRNDRGDLMHFVGVQADVTARRGLEEKVRQSQKMEAIGNLAGGLAHDFNNLLTVINGYSELVESQLPDSSPVRGLVREIGQAGERAASLTRQLLAFSRKQVLELKVINLNAVVTNTARMLKRLIGEDIDFNTALDPELGEVEADLGRIEQILINLSVNARDAMPQGGRLTIETRNVELSETYTEAFPELQAGAYVLLAVTDTGTGIDEKTKTHIFEPFFTTKAVGKGTGLGLATVFGIVKQSGGHVAVYSEPGSGATFKVYLPRVDDRVSASKSQAGNRSIPQGNETILLVEDEPALLALSRHILQRQGYTVLEADNGELALRIAEDYPGEIHLLLADVVMPGMSGRQVAERIAAQRPGVKVLFQSGYTDDAVVRHGVLQAETAFLQKPYTPTALSQKVREVLDKPDGPQTRPADEAG